MLAIQLGIRQTLQPSAINKAYLAAERRVLTAAAARGRVIARNAMRRRKRAARPGEAPSVRGGQLKRFLVYAFEPAQHVALFGPRYLSGSRQSTPEVLEHGKTVPRRVGRGRKRRWQNVRYEPRPAMVPALEKIMPGLPAMWKDSIR